MCIQEKSWAKLVISKLELMITWEKERSQNQNTVYTIIISDIKILSFCYIFPTSILEIPILYTENAMVTNHRISRMGPMVMVITILFVLFGWSQFWTFKSGRPGQRNVESPCVQGSVLSGIDHI